MSLEKKIYNSYAFSENEREKAKINYEIFKELESKYKVYRHGFSLNPDIDIKEYDIVIGRKPGYHHAVYNIIKNEPKLNTDELLLLCDGGNLCFGGSMIGKNQLRVSED